MMAKMTRIIIYPKDIALLTGKSVKYGRKTLLIIRKTLGKDSHQPITVIEYCEYYKIKVEEVTAILF